MLLFSHLGPVSISCWVRIRVRLYEGKQGTPEMSRNKANTASVCYFRQIRRHQRRITAQLQNSLKRILAKFVPKSIITKSARYLTYRSFYCIPFPVSIESKHEDKNQEVKLLLQFIGFPQYITLQNTFHVSIDLPL